MVTRIDGFDCRLTGKHFLRWSDEFASLWNRASDARQALATLPSSWSIRYFDALDFATSAFFELIRSLVAFEAGKEFEVLALKPDPILYFFHHFKKYPAFVVRYEHTFEDYYGFLRADPGGSPADALAFNAQEYLILPMSGSWCAFGNRISGVGRLLAQQNITELACRKYAYLYEHEDDLFPASDTE